MEIDFTSKDLSRLKYHLDRSTQKTELQKYKDRYETLVSDLEGIGMTLSEVFNETHEEKMDEEDQKLRWKLEILHEAKHKEETEEDEDYEG